MLCAGFGAALGAAARSPCAAATAAIACSRSCSPSRSALAGIGGSYYWAYRSTLSALADKNPEASMDAIRDEVTFSRWVDARKEAGWTMSSSHSTASRRNSPDIGGAGVLVVWAIEGLVLLGLTLLLVDTEAAKPYCERCEKWCVAKPLTLGGLGRADVEHAVQLGDLMPLVDIQVRADGDPSRSILLTGNVCDGCSDTAFLSVDEKITTQKKKQTSVKTVHLIKHAILTSQQRAAFVQRYNFAVGQKLAA